MALSLNKVAKEVISILKTEKPSGSKVTYWRMLSTQLMQEMSWDEELLNGVKTEINKWFDNQNNATVEELWKSSETAADEFDGTSGSEVERMLVDLKDELLDLILERVEEDNPKEEYFPSNDDLDLDDDYPDSNFLNNDFDDDIDDDYLDDRY